MTHVHPESTEHAAVELPRPGRLPVFEQVASSPAPPPSGDASSDSAASPRPHGPAQVLERDQPLSECMLWQLQEQFYQSLGITAWDTVPFYPTSNAFIGDTYAALVVALLMDLKPALTPAEPIYLLELATGSGCFSAFFLRALSWRIKLVPSLRRLSIRYVMTDFTEKNVQTWLEREELIPFFEEGLLDVAIFRPEEESELKLWRSGTVLKAGTVHNPLVVIANYFFDSLRQDVFRIEQGRFQLGRVTLYRYLQELSPSSPVRIDQVRVKEEYRPLPRPYYGDPVLEDVLRSYADEAETISLLYPLGALKALRRLQGLSQGRLALLSSDKGFTVSRYLHGLKKHAHVVHGSFSYMVNYEAIARFFQRQGGHAFMTADPGMVLATGLYVLDPELTDDLEHTRLMFEDRLNQHSDIHDLFTLHGYLRENVDDDDVVRCFLGVLRLSSYDPLIFESGAPRIYELIRDVDERYKHQLLLALPRVRANAYPMRGPSYRVLYWVGKLLYGMGAYENGIEVLDESLRRVSPTDANTLYYLGACHEMLDRDREALEFYLKARAFDPDCTTTQGAVQRVMQRLDAREQEYSG